jgi:hypothetical protein
MMTVMRMMMMMMVMTEATLQKAAGNLLRVAWLELPQARETAR